MITSSLIASAYENNTIHVKNEKTILKKESYISLVQFAKLQASISSAISILRKVSSENKALSLKVESLKDEIATLKKQNKETLNYIGTHFIREPVSVPKEIKSLEVFVYGKKAIAEQNKEARTKQIIEETNMEIEKLQKEMLRQEDL